MKDVVSLSDIATACSELQSNYGDFWHCAGFTDRSYEEGVRNRDFRESVDWLAAAGGSLQLIEKLRLGINGNLAHQLAMLHPDWRVSQNKSRGHDIEIAFSNQGLVAALEVKLVYDCTLPKYYPEVAADRQKMLALRDRNANAHLFHVVFFSFQTSIIQKEFGTAENDARFGRGTSCAGGSTRSTLNSRCTSWHGPIGLIRGQRGGRFQH
jgi:hypothetical protein